MLLSILNCQTAYAKALTVDRKTLAQRQLEGDVLGAHCVLVDAYVTNARPLLAVDEYLERGVTLIWIFDPQKKRVHVYRDDRRTTFSPGDALSGDDVLPGLEIKLQDIFTHK